jgi:hypothetical protein
LIAAVLGAAGICAAPAAPASAMTLGASWPGDHPDPYVREQCRSNGFNVQTVERRLHVHGTRAWRGDHRVEHEDGGVVVSQGRWHDALIASELPSMGV